MNLDELFAAAKKNGIGVLVIDTLHIGDSVTADTVIGGDQNTTTTNTVTVPREALSAMRDTLSLPRHHGHSVTVAPLDPWVGGYYAGMKRSDDDEYASKIHDGTLWS